MIMISCNKASKETTVTSWCKATCRDQFSEGGNWEFLAHVSIAYPSSLHSAIPYP